MSGNDSRLLNFCVDYTFFTDKAIN